MIQESIFLQCSAIIDAIAKERMQSGKVPTRNLPHATLLQINLMFSDDATEGGEISSLIESDGSDLKYVITKGEPKNYVDFWKTLPSWWGDNGVRQLLKQAGFYEGIIATQLMGQIYNGVCYGVLTMIRNPYDCVLVGLRSTSIAGEYGGFLSLPGGLVRPGESLAVAAARQLREEAGEELSSMVTLNEHSIAMGEHTSAPSFTFIVEGAYPFVSTPTHQSTGVDVHEWTDKGKLVWVPARLLDKAIRQNDAADVVAYFRQVGLNVAPTTKLAGDIIKPLSLLLL